MVENILIIGVPRSGTTWLSKVLAAGENIKNVHEPDNERHTYSAYHYKQNLPRFPFERKGDINSEKILKMFHHAFHGSYFGMGSFSNKILFKLSNFDKLRVELSLREQGINTPNLFKNTMWLYPFLPKEIKKHEVRIVKSVHSLLSLELLLENFKFKPVIIIRHPASIVSSCLELDNPDIDRKIYNNEKLMSYLFGNERPTHDSLDTIESKAAFQIAIFYKFISIISKKHPEILIVKHEDLAANPLVEFEKLFAKLDLNFNSNVVNFINKNNISGKGYDINRVASNTIDVWKSRLSQKQIDSIVSGYNLFPSSYYKNFK